ncbi:LEA domain protein [Aspergillus arachidicola]|uniref:LEA domain protein n=1 Tax=Aspergillus arachidicola TaxID=656916 RepID=A0A2G7FXD1_9EURO|nr:LEA domain protein [Aspergillus arachidicola]
MASPTLAGSPSTKGKKATPQHGKTFKKSSDVIGGEQRQQVKSGQQRASGSGGSPMPSEGNDSNVQLGGIAASPAQSASGSGPMGKTAMNESGRDSQGNMAQFKPSGGQAREELQKTASSAPGNLPTSLSALEGLQVSDGGHILDQNGQTVGQVVEGDPADLVGMTIGSDGEILDEDGDLVGRVDLLSKPGDEVEEKAADAGEAPSLGAAIGHPVNEDGCIMNDDEQPVAKVVDGDPRQLVGKTPNEQGQIYDEKGELLGRVEPLSTEEATGAIDEKLEGTKEQAGDTAHMADETAAEAKPL